MDKIDLVESLIGIYLGTFFMLGCLGLWDVLFGLRMEEAGIFLGLFMILSSTAFGVSLGLHMASLSRRVP